MTPQEDDELIALRKVLSRMNDEICQTLGKALGYPWFKDDQKNFPGATEENGVCVGEHVAESIAAEAASRLTAMREEIERKDALCNKYKWQVRDTCVRAEAAEAEVRRLTALLEPLGRIPALLQRYREFLKSRAALTTDHKGAAS
jgi:hypothetical protein